jgi:hypothetical protein
MVLIAVLSNNKFSFDNISYNDIQGNKFSQFLFPYIRMIEIPTSQNIMEYIIPYIGGKNINMHRSYKCYESLEYSTFLLYATNDTVTQQINEESNVIGRYLSERHEEVLGECILINSTQNQIISINYEQVIEIIRSRFIHKSILITPSNEITEMTYISNPIENTPINSENCRCVHIPFLTKILCVFIEHNPENNNLNTIATIICKKLRINGNVIISILDNYPNVEIIDLTKELFNKILCVQSNTSIASANNLTDEAIQTNFFSVLQRYVDKYNGEICENIPPDIMNGQNMNSTLHE